MDNADTTLPPVPLTILTGFLGAGKTTLLNRILRGEHGLKIAVLVNDFGAINIDSALITAVEDDVVSLANGCICCTMRDDLVYEVQKVVRRAERPDYVVIEASGVSDPMELLVTFAQPGVRGVTRLDSVVTVVDAEMAREQERYAELIGAQIAAADILVLNKVDLVTERQLAEVKEWVRGITPRARIVEAVQADAPLSLLLGIGATADHRSLTANHQPQTEHDGEHGHDHTSEFDTWSYRSDRAFVYEQLQAVLKRLPVTIFRAKGILWLAEMPDRKTIFQLVGRRNAFSVGGLWGDEKPGTKLVVIGAPGGVNGEELGKWLDECLAEE